MELDVKDLDTVRSSRLLQLIKDTEFPILQINGQRRYGPSPRWQGAPPPPECEVFLGRIPKNCYEDELVPFLSRVGTIYELRLMIDFNGDTRGYAFVKYSTKQEAERAVAVLNETEIRKGWWLAVLRSVNNCRIQITGLPSSTNLEEVNSYVRRITEDVLTVELWSDHSRPRGQQYALVQYDSHRAAAVARRKLISAYGYGVHVDWAAPKTKAVIPNDFRGKPSKKLQPVSSPGSSTSSQEIDAHNKCLNSNGNSSLLTLPQYSLHSPMPANGFQTSAVQFQVQDALPTYSKGFIVLL